MAEALAVEKNDLENEPRQAILLLRWESGVALLNCKNRRINSLKPVITVNPIGFLVFKLYNN